MTILVILFLLTLAEHLYSLLRKDGFCSSANTRVNLITQLCGTAKDVFIPALGVVSIITAVHNFIPHIFNIPGGALSFAACLLLIDFLYYLFHRVSHKFAIPWMFHFVHHSGHKFNLSAGFRSSFFEILTLFSFYSLALLVGFPLATFILAFQVTSTYQFMTHSRYLRMPKSMEFAFVTPAYHLIHHDQSIKNQNSNYGGVFSFWDRMFGTYVKEIENFRPGLKGYEQSNFIKIHTDPVIMVTKKMFANLSAQ